MAIRQGNSDVSAIFLGNTEITKVYQGATEIYSADVPSSNAYIIEVNTENLSQFSSPDDTFKIPTSFNSGAGYNFEVDWGDGVVETFEGNNPLTEHQYSSPGIYDIKITGLFPQIRFTGSGDRLKLLKIKQWGNTSWSNFDAAYQGCNNLQIVATDSPVLTNVTNMSFAFFQCNDANFSTNHNFNTWDVSNVTSMVRMFDDTQFNQPISDWNVSNVTTIFGMFRNSQFNQDLSAWNITGLTSAEKVFENSQMDVENYSRTLIGWANTVFANGNLPVNIDMTDQAGRTYNNTQYTTGNQFNDAVSARNYLITTCNWDITGDSEV